MPGIGIVTNPNSRRNRRFPEQMRRLGYILGQDDMVQLTNQPRDVNRVAEEFLRNDIDILALNGGDGTNHCTLTTFIEVYGDTPLPKVAFLRGGTMNTISESVGAAGKPGSILLNLVERYYTKQDFDITQRDMLKVIDGDCTRYGFIFASGVISNFLNVYYEDPSPSPTVAATTLARILVSAAVNGPLVARVFEPIVAEIELDGDLIAERGYACIAVSTIEQAGLGWRPFYRCEEKPHAFHAGLFKGDTGRDHPGAHTHAHRKGPRASVVDNRVATEMLIKSPNPVEYTIDGDMHTCASGDLRVETGPRLDIILG